MSAPKVWNGTSWEFIGGAPNAAVQPGAPSGPAVGQLWLDTDELAQGQGNGAYVCTSTTRPTVPAAGLMIYETDTGYLRIYSGSAWLTVSSGPGGAYLGTEVSLYPSAAAPPAGTQKIVKQGTAVISVSASSGTVTYPEAFPNGIVSAIAISGDGNAYGGGYVGRGYTLSALTVGTTTAVTGPVSHRINYIVYGW